jgi:co-chaperonin GroES (HSP10)
MTKATNKSGILPTEFKVIILPKEAADKIGSVYIPDESKDRNQYAQIEGTLIAASPLAFTYVSKAEWSAAGGEPPKAGDTVLFAKYAGTTRRGKDGVEYRIVNDKDIWAVLA